MLASLATSQRFLLQLGMLFGALLLVTDAFQGAAIGNGRLHTHETRVTVGRSLIAWSMPTPTSNAFGSLTSSWYNEVNPTARRIVYDE